MSQMDILEPDSFSPLRKLYCIQKTADIWFLGEGHFWLWKFEIYTVSEGWKPVIETGAWG